MLTEKQKEDIKEALEALTSHLRALKKLHEQALQEISYNPQDLISISKEMADKIGVEFDEKEFI